MKIPAIRGIIDRRILANFRIDPDVMSRVLPAPFRPKLIHGFAIGGICLIRLKGIRPRFLPFPCGIGSENAAHRIAVEWDRDGEVQQGVYIPRRDTNSRLNTWAGGLLFPGVHHFAEFTVEEQAPLFSVSMQSKDSIASVAVSGTLAADLPRSSIFPSLAAASEFFAAGSLGYSETRTKGQYDGLELQCQNWHVETLEINRIESSFFEDKSQFPVGSVEFDCALLMRGIRHEWHSREDLCCAGEVQA